MGNVEKETHEYFPLNAYPAPPPARLCLPYPRACFGFENLLALHISLTHIYLLTNTPPTLLPSPHLMFSWGLERDTNGVQRAEALEQYFQVVFWDAAVHITYKYSWGGGVKLENLG